jgi:hypothetical protein
VFIERMEAQLEGNDDPRIRSKVNGIYERLINAIFGSLQQLAKMDRAEGQAAEDKGQLNYHVIMIGERATDLTRNRLTRRREHASSRGRSGSPRRPGAWRLPRTR